MALVLQAQARPHLFLSAYEREALKTNRIDPAKAHDALRFGLFGEIGSLLTLVKKSYRELVEADHDAIAEELGDALWYVANVAVTYGLTLQQVGERAMASLGAVTGAPPTAATGELSFDQFDALMTLLHAKWPEDRKPEILRALAAEAGQLMVHDGTTCEPQLFAGEVRHHLSGLLANMVVVASMAQQSITTVAQRNIAKITSRWPGPNPTYREPYDEDYSELEQFPREVQMHFIERRPEVGRPYVIQRLNNVNIGDRLTDNRTEEDGYRFHDVFHLAYLTHLGWSPVIRALLKLKRKSKPDVDENQDGARAIIIEEGIATWIFNQGRSRKFFIGIERGRLSYDLLKQVKDMVKGYEVEDCPLWQWENAILDGFRIFLALHDSETGCGIVTANLKTRTMDFVELPAPADKRTKPETRRRIVGALPPDCVSNP
jgi:NTP pyrophosphatase (non-canonical NTP hydrolase)